ncbi:catechol 2,3-dioxygenase-like lactoylglutathione lyase family enzyme [Natronocella acetinitrilica]|uniref:Catechol 2,3-dioxygenase-like lactoylglutathione lyase family enzyme n=1 Tax=Natronocella acetinitrilica TaxID=414046 RepID=A0AAE3KCE4_9GAMM|nr:VOC family protein [Natronocella acetinitrilica]MCP1674838.1 catechol 2,3-dioxygenase-like lactoylglutathione lyase family enzyme [Natronocella acetinitrilica]
MKTLGIHHLGLAVSDLEATANFFIDCLGWSLVREVPEYPAKFVSNGEAFFTLWQTNADSASFDRKSNVGLHHVAIKVASEQDLQEIFDTVSGHSGVTVEFAPELLRGGPAKHCIVYEPSGIRIEFIWAP